MKTKIYKMSTRRTYKHGQLTDGFDIEGEFDNFGKQPKMMVKTYNPVTNKKRTFSNRDFQKLFHESSPNSLSINLKQLLKKSNTNRQSKRKKHSKQNKHNKKQSRRKRK